MGGFFTRNIRFAFGHGGDQPGCGRDYYTGIELAGRGIRLILTLANGMRHGPFLFLLLLAALLFGGAPGARAFAKFAGNIYEEKGGKVLHHVYAGGQQVCSFETNSTLFGGSDTNRVAYYYHEDDLNSSTALSSGGTTGTQIEVDAYYPFGRVMTASPQASFKVSRQFTGQIKDDDTGLYYYNARYYDPELGRFIQPDTEIPDLSNPQSYNRYSYCVNNPLRYTDPTGHGPNDDDDPTEHLSLTLGGNHAVERQSAGGASATLYRQAGPELGRVAAIGQGVAEMNPIVGAANGGISAYTGRDAVTQAQLTGGQRVLAGVGGVVSIIPGEGAEMKAGAKVTEKIADEALVVRGGRNLVEDIKRGTGTHPSGVVGVSVESAEGKTVKELSENIPHGQVGVTTVGDVRAAGGDVVQTSGRSPNHATLTGLSHEDTSKLLTPTIPNPAKQQ